MFLASTATVDPAAQKAALIAWQQCIDDAAEKLTDEIRWTSGTGVFRGLSDAISRVALAQCDRRWGWELNGINKERQQQVARKRARKASEGIFQHYALEDL